jgi:hypothetical protein
MAKNRPRLERANDVRNLTASNSIIKMQSAVNLAAAFSLASAIAAMSVPHSEILLPPCCELCGGATASLGKLPPIGARPLVYVYKCKPCNRISSVESRPQCRDPRQRSARQPQQGNPENT